MKTFKEFQKDYKRKYVALELDRESAAKMRKWCIDNGFDLSVKYNGEEQNPSDFDFHITVFYSENPVHFKEGIEEIEPVEINLTKFEWLGEDKNVPVYLVDKTDELLNIRTIYQSLGLKDKWDEWKPHVSLSYNKTIIDTKNLKKPTFRIFSDRIKTNHIDD